MNQIYDAMQIGRLLELIRINMIEISKGSDILYSVLLRNIDELKNHADDMAAKKDKK